MDDDSKLIEALWATVAAHGWRGVTPRRLAAASGVPARDIVARFPNRLDLLRLHAEVADAAVLAGTVPGQGGTPHDRIFDVLMRRIDTAQPHRPGLLRMLEDMRRDPLLPLAMAPILRESMRRMLDAAGLDSAGPSGAARALGLAGVWLATLRAWEKDAGEDLGTTMAALDRALERAEQVARSFGIGPGDLEPDAGEPPPAA
jgi:AcrR family transcriptional regulator